ncbi:MAG: hypothetical protein WCB70_03300 [Xanthobacteraceae bacterium]
MIDLVERRVGEVVDQRQQEAIISPGRHVCRGGCRKAGRLLVGKDTTFDVPFELSADLLGE